jgi:hypothetical protein
MEHEQIHGYETDYDCDYEQTEIANVIAISVLG